MFQYAREHSDIERKTRGEERNEGLCATEFDDEKADFRRMKRVSERNKKEKETSRKGRKAYGDCEYGYFTTGWIIAPTSGFLSFGLKPITFGRSSCEPFG